MGNNKLTRMSIDINAKDHKKIKMRAARERISIREFVLGCIQQKMVPDQGDRIRNKKA